MVGSSRWAKVSRVWIQKLPCEVGRRPTEVGIGRPLIELLAL